MNWRLADSSYSISCGKPSKVIAFRRPFSARLPKSPNIRSVVDRTVARLTAATVEKHARDVGQELYIRERNPGITALWSGSKDERVLFPKDGLSLTGYLPAGSQ